MMNQEETLAAENEVEAIETNGAGAEGTAENTNAAPNETVTALQSEIETWKERYARMTSDFDNFKKRTNKEKEQLVRFGNEQLLKAFLPVLDDLERALLAAETSENVTSIREGITLVHKNLKYALEKQGVSQISAIGQPFDPEFHEAIGVRAVEETEEKGKIIEEFEKGYMFNEKVLRCTRVVIGE